MAHEMKQEVWVRRLVLILIGVGIILRVNRYLYGFPFWGDEAWVAQEVVRRSFQEIMLNTNLQPSISLLPIGFMILEKSLVVIAGYNELVFRLLPCVCGVMSVVLFAKLLKGLVRSRVMLMSLALFVLSDLLIYYSSELKQYSLDVFLVILVLVAHCRAVACSMDNKDTIWLAFVGLLGMFFSLPIVIVLFSVAAVQVVVYLQKKFRQEMLRYVLVFCIWGLGFWGLWSGYYHVNYEGTEALAYKAPYYLSSPFIQGGWGGWLDKLLAFFKSPVGAIWPGLAALTFVLGCWSMWRRNRTLLLLLVAPILLTIALSMASLYPFHDRFIVFLLPFVFVLIAQGLDQMMDVRYWGRACGVVILTLLLIPSMVHARSYVTPSAVTDIRSLILYMQAQQKPTDRIYFNNESRWGYYLYNYLFSFHDLEARGILYELPSELDQPGQLFGVVSPDRSLWGSVYRWDHVVDPSGNIMRMPGGGRTWILLSQVDAAKERVFVSCFDSFGKKLDEKRSKNASLYLYDLK